MSKDLDRIREKYKEAIKKTKVSHQGDDLDIGDLHTVRSMSIEYGVSKSLLVREIRAGRLIAITREISGRYTAKYYIPKSSASKWYEEYQDILETYPQHKNIRNTKISKKPRI